jgi:hypothetical protein
MIRSTTTRLIGTEKATRGSFPFRSYAATTAIAVISTMISGTANAAAVSNVLAREFLSVDFLANIGEALRVASVRKSAGFAPRGYRTGGE